MSVTGYFTKNKPELNMPKTDSVAGTDGLGIRYEGPVLTGMRGVKQQLEHQAASSLLTGAQIREIAPGGATYVPPAEYLQHRDDTRLERDPLYALQRSNLAHPSLADPVLRHHLNLPPLPDPYEERRRAAEYWEKERHKYVK